MRFIFYKYDVLSAHTFKGDNYERSSGNKQLN